MPRTKSLTKSKKMRGGSPASNSVMNLLPKNCPLAKDTPLTPPTNDDVSGMKLHQTTGGRRVIRKRTIRRKTTGGRRTNIKSKTNIKRRTNKKRSNRRRGRRGGGSDWLSTVRSRGPAGVPDMSLGQFRSFTKTADYIPNTKL